MNKNKYVNNKNNKRVGMVKNDKRHFCRWCRVWMPNDSAVLLFISILQTIANHEASKTHKLKSAKFILQQQIVEQHIEEEKLRTINTLKYIQKEAEKQVAGDVYRKTPAYLNSNIGKKEDPDDLYANFKSNGECAMGDYTDQPIKPKQPKKSLFSFELSSVPPPPSTPPPPIDNNFPPPPPPPNFPPPKPKLDPDHTFKIARRNPPPPINGENYRPLSDFINKIILGCLVKSINTKDVWKDSILINIGEKKIEGTTTVIPKYTVVDIISEKQYELIADQIYLLESELNKCIEMNSELANTITIKDKNIIWKSGMQCQARYSVNFEWYPAIIINTNKDVTYVTVIFAGYLNKETLPVSFVCPLGINPEDMKKEEIVNGHEVIDIVYLYIYIILQPIQTYGDWQTISVKELTKEEVQQQETALDKAKYEDLITEEESRQRIEKEILNQMVDDNEGELDTLNTFNPHGGDLYKGVNIKAMTEPVLEDLTDVPLMLKKEDTNGVKIEFKKKKKKNIFNKRNKDEDE